MLHGGALTAGRREITLFLCGDVMTGRGIDQILPCPAPPRLYERVVTSALDYVALAERASGAIPAPVDYAYPWGEALDALGRARPGARIINLETAVTTSEDAAPKGINYRMHPANAPVLTAARIDCCVLANNHLLDWGRAGLVETLETLERAGVAAAGAGRDLDAARAPAVLRVSDAHRVLVFAFGAEDSGIPATWSAGERLPGVHFLDELSHRTADDIARLVHEAKLPGDVAVASVHWGSNWGYDVPSAHRRFAHALVERAGIDVVHGHSSHHPRGIEIHEGRPILYGCGDFLNDYEGIPGYREYRGDLAVMYFPTLDGATGALTKLEMTPLHIRRFRLSTPSSADREWLRGMLDRECRRFGHRVVPRGDGFVLEWR